MSECHAGDGGWDEAEERGSKTTAAAPTPTPPHITVPKRHERRHDDSRSR